MMTAKGSQDDYHLEDGIEVPNGYHLENGEQVLNTDNTTIDTETIFKILASRQ